MCAPLVLLEGFLVPEGFLARNTTVRFRCTGLDVYLLVSSWRAPVNRHLRRDGAAEVVDDRIRVHLLVKHEVAALGKGPLADIAAVEVRDALPLFVRLPVGDQVCPVGEAPVTHVALEGFLLLVEFRVGDQVVLAREAPLTDGALKGLLVHVTPYVGFKVALATKGPLADVADKQPLASVASPVHVALRLASESLRAELAGVDGRPGVEFLVGDSVLLGGKALAAESAGEGTLVGGLHRVDQRAAILQATPLSGAAEDKRLFRVGPLVMLGVLPCIAGERTVGAEVGLLQPLGRLDGVLDSPVPVGAVFCEEKLAARLARGTGLGKVDVDFLNNGFCLAPHARSGEHKTLPNSPFVGTIKLALFAFLGGTDGNTCRHGPGTNCNLPMGSIGA